MDDDERIPTERGELRYAQFDDMGTPEVRMTSREAGLVAGVRRTSAAKTLRAILRFGQVAPDAEDLAEVGLENTDEARRIGAAYAAIFGGVERRDPLLPAPKAGCTKCLECELRASTRSIAALPASPLPTAREARRDDPPRHSPIQRVQDAKTWQKMPSSRRARLSTKRQSSRTPPKNRNVQRSPRQSIAREQRQNTWQQRRQ